MRQYSESGVTLIEILIAVSLLSLLSVGMLVAMRLGFNTMDKTDKRLVADRRITNSRQIIENEITGYYTSMAYFRPRPLEMMPFIFLQNEPRTMRFVTSYSIDDGWRGRPRIAALQVIPGENSEGVRLIVNETLYTGPDQAGQMITGFEQNPGRPLLIHYAPVEAGTQSFVLADRLAYCRFLYLEKQFTEPFQVWRAERLYPQNLPLAVKIEMAPLDPKPNDLRISTVTIPFHVNADPENPMPTSPPRSKRNSRRGSALLMVLWLTAALSAVGLAVANNVRSETERTETNVDDARSYFVARGAIEDAALHMLWSKIYRNPDGTPLYFTNGMRSMELDFPGARVHVDVIPELAKLNLNTTREEELWRLLLALGQPDEKARELVAAIVDWRNRVDLDHPSPFDAFYLSQTPSFRPRHASFLENEELLQVKGMTAELYYGSTLGPSPTARGSAGLRDCLSIYGSTGGAVDINTAELPTLEAVGILPADAEAIVKIRSQRPFTDYKELSEFAQTLGPGGRRLMIGGLSMYTLRATARLKQPDGKLSDLRRTVGALIKFYFFGNNELKPVGFDVVRWFDRA